MARGPLVFTLLIFMGAPVAFASGECPGDLVPSTEMHPNGQVAKLRCLDGDAPEGPARDWAEDGTLLLEGQYSHGAMSGEWLRYWPNGKLKDRGGWKDGKPQGRWTQWHETGDRKFEGEFAEGGPTCRGLSWASDGKRLAENVTTDTLPDCQRHFFPEDRRFLHQLKVGAFYALQDSGGFSLSPYGGWTVHWKWASSWSFGLGVDQTAVASSGTPRFLGVTQANLGIYMGAWKYLLVGLGGGAQWWWNVNRPYPEAQVELIWRLPFKLLWVIQDLHTAGSVFFYPNDVTFITRIAVGITL